MLPATVPVEIFVFRGDGPSVLISLVLPAGLQAALARRDRICWQAVLGVVEEWARDLTGDVT